ncbi:MAG: sigma factor sigB regulation protein rsbU [Bdellovibrio sp. CG10_big_fil_rev_8_21_14_0_10_47_8]|nr:MAG: sigma factor sigB regulation protein rsbU [Bdellovibrio sp. CG10_big_fil_rev_8_21_14_0_10_47_8]
MNHRGLSIRYKILLLLTLVPLVTLSLYLVLAVRVFESDKLAYVFESGSSLARTLSSQSTTDLNSVLSLSKPVMQEFLLSGSFGPVAKAVFESEGKLDWVAVYSKNPEGKFEKSGIVEKIVGSGDRDILSFQDVTPLLSESLEKGRLLRVPFKDDRILLVERVVNDRSPDVKIFMIMSRLPDLANSFRATSGSEVFLVNDQGFILFGPAGSEASYLSQKMPLDFLASAKEKNLNSGTELVQGGQGKSLLASFSRSNFGELTVISVVDRAEALRAVDILIRRSLVFFVLLLAASVIVSLFASGSLTSALTALASATRQVAEGHFDIRVAVRSRDEIGGLAESFNAMAGEVSRLMGETAEKARMESELKTAQTVQETLFPPTQATMGGLQISGHYEPASECGGDWWHYCEVDGKVFLWIGDATGHGAPAALITSAAKSAATIIERLNVDPAHAMELLNRAIYDVSKGRIMMTFFLACYDPVTKLLTYANASHEAPFLIQQKEGDLKKRDLIPLNEVNSPRLGQERETKYEQTTVQLNAGDRILFYTDGIPDIENPAKDSWGEREFIKSIISTNSSFPPIEESVSTMVAQFSEYRKGAPLKDDITFFMTRCSEDGV